MRVEWLAPNAGGLAKGWNSYEFAFRIQLGVFDEGEWVVMGCAPSHSPYDLREHRSTHPTSYTGTTPCRIPIYFGSLLLFFRLLRDFLIGQITCGIGTPEVADGFGAYAEVAAADIEPSAGCAPAFYMQPLILQLLHERV